MRDPKPPPTRGGRVSIGGYPQLTDGGIVKAPRWAIFRLNGESEVENRGISPDVEAEHNPQPCRQGKDPQLEKAVEIVLAELIKHPWPIHRNPPYPNYHPK